jgi:hypothetical protein
MHCSEDQDNSAKRKEIVREEITIYTAEGPKKMYHYGFKDVTDKTVDKLTDKKKLNEFEKADLILQAIKDKKIKHKL